MHKNRQSSGNRCEGRDSHHPCHGGQFIQSRRDSMSENSAPISARLAIFLGVLSGHEFALGLAMTKEQLMARTKQFGLDIIALVRSLPRETAATHIARQLVRSGTAVGSNYRASCRAKSKADFISKMAWVEEEGDESLFWMEMLLGSKTVPATSLARLMDEADQLVRIAVASINTARGGPREE